MNLTSERSPLTIASILVYTGRYSLVQLRLRASAVELNNGKTVIFSPRVSTKNSALTREAIQLLLPSNIFPVIFKPNAPATGIKWG